MAKLLRYEEWQGISGDWYCNDTSDLSHGSGYWWLPARMMKLSPAQYIQWVIDNFHPDTISHSEDCSYVGFSWKNQNEMRRYKNKINALARQEKFMIC